MHLENLTENRTKIIAVLILTALVGAAVYYFEGLWMAFTAVTAICAIALVFADGKVRMWEIPILILAAWLLIGAPAPNFGPYVAHLGIVALLLISGALVVAGLKRVALIPLVGALALALYLGTLSLIALGGAVLAAVLIVVFVYYEVRIGLGWGNGTTSRNVPFRQVYIAFKVRGVERRKFALVLSDTSRSPSI